MFRNVCIGKQNGLTSTTIDDICMAATDGDFKNFWLKIKFQLSSSTYRRLAWWHDYLKDWLNSGSVVNDTVYRQMQRKWISQQSLIPVNLSASQLDLVNWHPTCSALRREGSQEGWQWEGGGLGWYKYILWVLVSLRLAFSLWKKQTFNSSRITSL